MVGWDIAPHVYWFWLLPRWVCVGKYASSLTALRHAVGSVGVSEIYVGGGGWRDVRLHVSVGIRETCGAGRGVGLSASSMFCED